MATIASATIEDGVALTGDLRPIETIDVRARIEGDLTGVFVREGQQVTAGQLLAQFESSEQESSQKSAEAMPNLMTFQLFTFASVQARLKTNNPTPNVSNEPNAPTKTMLKFQNAQTMPVKPMRCAANCHFTSHSLKGCVSKVTGTS